MTKQLPKEGEPVPRNELRGLEGEARLYHVWFATKLRKWLLLGDVEVTAKRVLRAIAAEKDIDLREVGIMPDHAHVLLSLPSGELASKVKLLKGVSARRLFQAFPELKLDARTSHFWQRGFGYREIEDDASGVALVHSDSGTAVGEV